MRELINSFGGRKFLLTVSILLGVIAAIATNTMVDPDLLSLVKWTVGLYFAGNVAQKATSSTATTTEETASTTKS